MSFRRPLVILLLAVAACAAVVPSASAGATTSAREYQTAPVSALSGPRAANGVAALRVDSRLTVAAKGQSAYLAGAGKLDHTGPDGSSVLARLSEQGFHGHMVGENLAAGMGP